MVAYFERVTRVCLAADAHIQTAALPAEAATAFSLDHPDFAGSLEVVVQELVDGRPRLRVFLMQIQGPEQCSSLSQPITIYTLGAYV